MNQAAKVQEAKGPLVWLDMDQKALDDAYDQMVYAPNRDQVHKRNMFNSDRVRARLGAPKRLAYGSNADRAARSVSRPRSRTRRSTCSSTAAPGGRGTVKDYAFLAEMFVRAGGHWVGLDFDGVEGTNGDLLPMADQVRRGVAWVYKNAKSFGGDPDRIYVSGQSSGGASRRRVVTTDWEGLRRAGRHREGRALCPRHVRSQAGAAVEALGVSCLHRRDRGEAVVAAPSRPARCPVIVAYGTYETPEFQRQSRDFAAAVKAAGKPVTLLVAEGYNHFEIAGSDRQSAEPARPRGAGDMKLRPALTGRVR